MIIELEEFLTAEVKEELKEAFNEGRFKWIGDFGFFTYWEIIRDGQLYIFVNNLWIEPQYRKQISLFWIRKFMREKYKDRNLKFCYWHREKRDRFFYVKGVDNYV